MKLSTFTVFTLLIAAANAQLRGSGPLAQSRLEGSIDHRELEVDGRFAAGVAAAQADNSDPEGDSDDCVMCSDVYLLTHGVQCPTVTRHIYNDSPNRAVVMKINGMIMNIAPGGSVNDYELSRSCTRMLFWDGATGTKLGEYTAGKGGYISHNGRTDYLDLNDPADGDVTVWATYGQWP